MTSRKPSRRSPRRPPFGHLSLLNLSRRRSRGGRGRRRPPDSSVRARFERAVGGSARLFAGLVLAVLVESLVIMWLWGGDSESLVSTGELVVQSRPPGATVTLNDKVLGTTPVTVRLSPDIYTLKVQLGSAEPRVIAVQIREGVQTVQYLELQIEPIKSGSRVQVSGIQGFRRIRES